MINRMRRAIATFLILLMLTPALACAMTICASPVSAGAAQITPCDHGGKPDAPRAPALMKDCAGVDLQLAQDPVIPDNPAANLVASPQPDIFSARRLAVQVRISGVADEPPDDRVLRLNPRYLATQRLLI